MNDRMGLRNKGRHRHRRRLADDRQWREADVRSTERSQNDDLQPTSPDDGATRSLNPLLRSPIDRMLAWTA
jgi:hypothetical protein